MANYEKDYKHYSRLVRLVLELFNECLNESTDDLLVANSISMSIEDKVTDRLLCYLDDKEYKYYYDDEK